MVCWQNGRNLYDMVQYNQCNARCNVEGCSANPSCPVIILIIAQGGLEDHTYLENFTVSRHLMAILAVGVQQFPYDLNMA